MVIGVFLCFVLVTAALALVFLPDARAWAQARMHRALAGGRAVGKRAASVGPMQWQRAASAVGARGADASSWAGQHARWIALSAVLLMAAPLIAIATRGLIELEGFDHRASRPVNEQVAALLSGEHLVPPPPLPPQMFTSREVEQARPLIRDASRQWELLDDDFRQRMLIVFKLMHERHGYDMVLLEGYRSPERQARLAGFGSRVTLAGAYESYHQYGLAADCAFIRNGRIVVSEADPWARRGYELYGEVARSLGLTWGGGWRTIQDLGHVELRRPGLLQTRSDATAPTSALAH